MNANVNSLSRWSTASIGEAPQPMAGAGELLGLGDHLNLCRTLHGRYHRLQCLLEEAHIFMATHVFTSAVLITLLIGFGSLVV